MKTGMIHPTEGRQLFGADAAGYDAARPEYPDEVYARLVERCGLRAGARAFEIGAGTGKVTRQLLRRGAGPVVAIEPDARLAAWLDSSSTCLTVTIKPFEEVDLPAAAFDLGVAATAFHWLDQDVALQKIAQALRPGGWWAMWWNVFGDPQRRDDFHQATQSLFESVARTPSTGPGRQHYALDVEARLRDLEATQQFDDIEHELLRWTLRLTADEVVALYATFLPVILLAPPAHERFLASLREIAERQFAGVVERPMVTPIYMARRA